MTPAPQQQKRRRRPRSRFGVQLQEKQDLKHMFGVREEQLRKYYKQALHLDGETGPELISLLERRLDNAIYRAGYAETRGQARQMATHRLFEVNGHPVDVPSYTLSPGDTVKVRDSKQKSALFSNFEKRMQNVRPPSWLQIDPKKFSFEVVEIPTADEAAVGVDIRAIVELFAR